VTSFRTVLPLLILLMLDARSADGSPHPDAPITLNRAAFNFARELIIQGHFVTDKKGVWSTDHPTRSQETVFIRANGFSEYSKWYLAIDERHSADSKACYKFPFGDFARVHRCGLLAVKARAREYGYREIEAAADQLLAEIEINGPRR